MSVLKPHDIPLHEGDGITHIDPGKDPNLKARLQRHLAAHARGDLPDLAMLGKEWVSANEGVRQAREHRTAIRDYIIKIAKEYDAQGLHRTTIADKLGINRRTLSDWLEHGVAINRGR